MPYEAVWLFGKPHRDAMVSSTNIIAICHCIAQYTDTHRTLNRIKFIFPSMQWLMQTSCGFKVRANHQKYFTSPTSCRCDFCAQCGLLYIYPKPKLLYSVVRSFGRSHAYGNLALTIRISQQFTIICERRPGFACN